jgi:hypothetical protein
MNPLELKKLEVELARVSTAKLEMEYRIEERQFEISNLHKNIINQDVRIQELNEMITKMKESR